MALPSRQLAKVLTAQRAGVKAAEVLGVPGVRAFTQWDLGMKLSCTPEARAGEGCLNQKQTRSLPARKRAICHRVQMGKSPTRHNRWKRRPALGLVRGSPPSPWGTGTTNEEVGVTGQDCQRMRSSSSKAGSRGKDSPLTVND